MSQDTGQFTVTFSDLNRPTFAARTEGILIGLAQELRNSSTGRLDPLDEHAP